MQHSEFLVQFRLPGLFPNDFFLVFSVPRVRKDKPKRFGRKKPGLLLKQQDAFWNTGVSAPVQRGFLRQSCPGLPAVACRMAF
jgi:hypothetical protein